MVAAVPKMEGTTAATAVSESAVTNSSAFTESEYVNNVGSSGSGKTFDAVPYLLSVGCLGVLDNAFVVGVVVFYTSMTKRLTGRLILNQSCVDSVASLMVVIRQANISVRGIDLPFGGVFGELYCRLWVTGGIQWMFILSSSLNLVAITIERYISVVFPIYHKRYCTIRVAAPVIACVWLLGAAFEMGWCGPSSEVINGFCARMTFGGNPHALEIYGTSSVVIYFFVPITCMFFCYSHMVYTLRRKAKAVMPLSAGNSSTGHGSKHSQLSSAQRNLFKTMFMVSACFVACWSWYEIVWLCLSQNLMFNQMLKVLDYAHLVALFNLVINPFIYIFHYQEFRKGLRVMARRRFRTGHMQETSTDDGTSGHTQRT